MATKEIIDRMIRTVSCDPPSSCHGVIAADSQEVEDHKSMSVYPASFISVSQPFLFAPYCILTCA